MKGMNAKTGSLMKGMDYLRQSILDILSTPIGSRLMRRNYGSRLMSLLDSPTNYNFVPEIQGAVIEALVNHLPSIRLLKVTVNDVNYGKIDLTLSGYYVPNNRSITLENISIS